MDAGKEAVEAAHQCWSSTSEWCAMELWLLYALCPVGCTAEGSHPARNNCQRRRIFGQSGSCIMTWEIQTCEVVKAVAEWDIFLKSQCGIIFNGLHREVPRSL